MTRFSSGFRKITQISEILKSKEYQLQDIFVFEEGLNQSGQIRATGKIPTLYQKLKNKAGYICNEFEGVK